MSYRVLRCANGTLYMGFVLGIIAAAAYVCATKLTDFWEISAVIFFTLIAALWGGFYYFLRIRIDETGITRSILFYKEHIDWANIKNAEVRQLQSPGTEACTIILTSPTVTMTISSDLLPLTQVEELADELKNNGILP